MIDEKPWGFLSSPQAYSHPTFCCPHAPSSPHMADARGNRNKLPVTSHPATPVWPDSFIWGLAMRAWPRVCPLIPPSPSSQPSWCPIKELSYLTIALFLYLDLFLPAHSDGPIDHRCGQWALYTNTLWDLKHLKHYQAVTMVKGLSSGLTYCKRPSQLFTLWACNLQHDTGWGFFTFVFSLISFPLCKSSADFLEVSLCTWDMWNVGIIF